MHHQLFTYSQRKDWLHFLFHRYGYPDRQLQTEPSSGVAITAQPSAQGEDDFRYSVGPNLYLDFDTCTSPLLLWICTHISAPIGGSGGA